MPANVSWQRFHRITRLCLPSLVILAGLLNGALLIRQWRTPTDRRPQLPAGARISNATLQSIDGKSSESLTWPSSPTIVYWFAPTCPWCAKNLDNVKALFAATHGKYRFVGVSSTGGAELSKYVADFHLPFPVYVAPKDFQRAWKLLYTPATIVVSGDGTVQKVWLGAYGAATAPEVERLLKVHLPGLIVAPVPRPVH